MQSETESVVTATTVSAPQLRQAGLAAKVARARAVLFWERLWPALLPAVLFVGAVICFALFGGFEVLPRNLHIVVLGAVLIGLGVLLRPLAALRFPTRADALRRLETVAGLPHRPASSYEDTLSSGAVDAATATLWQTHKARLRARLKALRAGWPRPGVARRDPYALRAALMLLLVVAFSWAGPDAGDRLRSIFTPAGDSAPVARVWIDAWVTPPAYTARPPVFLSGSRVVSGAATDRPVEVPANSELVIRVTGADQPNAVIRTAGAGATGGGAGAASESAEQGHPFSKAAGEVRELRMPLTASGEALVRDGGADLAAWRFTVIPDTAPVIGLAGEIATTSDQALQFKYSIEDDYGVIAAEADLTLDREAIDTAEGTPPVAGSSDVTLEIAPPEFPLVLPRARVKAATPSVYRDLTAHPWAGLPVILTLKARDEAGQTGTSDPIKLVLPERQFRQPLAQALVEQRRKLVRRPGSAALVARALGALTLLPEQVTSDTTVYLGMTTAERRLDRDHTSEELAEVVDLLWDLALRVEDGDMSLAERELRAAQEALRRALAENAPPEEIERLMSDLRKALDRFMQALAEQMRRNAENAQPQPLPPNARQIRPQDLDRMMEMIENLARTGANDAAQEMLSQLSRILENLQAGMPTPGNPQQQGQMSQWLDELGDLMGRQQQLMDETFRNQQGEGQPQPGEGQPGGDQQTLADQQQALRDMLGRLMEQFNQNGLNTPSPFGRADQAMGDATGQLREGQNGEAVGNQGEALDQMRQGANSLARQMLEGMGTAGRQGQQGQRGAEGQVDPLGRPLKSTGPDFGTSTKVPGEIDIQRAREIMRELQRRLGDQTRPRLELDYLERLLRRF